MSTGPLKYGLPLRPPTASTALWAHILRQDTQPSTSLSDTPIVVPPTVPLDKNATSMRVLLHDTQANFEKFAIHVGKLIDGVNETKHEIKTTSDLFERDRQTLVGDIIDLVNRSQKEIQKSVGSPCQTASTETYFKDVNHRLDTLDQRLDAIQAFNQTHSQALQTQIQAIQILLDKQGTIVSAVLPLLPLLQAVPLHIEATRNALNDAISKLTSTQKLTSDSPNQNVAIKIAGKRKQSQRSSSSSPLAESPCKRRRNSTEVLKDATPTVQSSREKPDFTSESSVRQHRPFKLSSSSTLKTRSPLQKSSPLTHLANTHTSTSSLGRHNTFVLPKFSTPRKPLHNLPVQPSLQTALKLPSTLIHGNSVPRANTTMSRPSPQVLTDITPTAARPPRMLRVHASISNNIRNGPFSGPDMSTTNKVPPLSPAPDFLPNHSAMGDPQNGPSVIDLVKSKVVPTAVALNNMKEAPRIGRRFIPLIDSEDEDEE